MPNLLVNSVITRVFHLCMFMNPSGHCHGHSRGPQPFQGDHDLQHTGRSTFNLYREVNWRYEHLSNTMTRTAVLLSTLYGVYNSQEQWPTTSSFAAIINTSVIYIDIRDYRCPNNCLQVHALLLGQYEIEMIPSEWQIDCGPRVIKLLCMIHKIWPMYNILSKRYIKQGNIDVLTVC